MNSEKIASAFKKTPIRILLAILVAFLFVTASLLLNNRKNTLPQSPPEEYIIYLSGDYGTRKLFFYDIEQAKHTPILPDWNVEDFSISSNDQLAFLSSDEGKSNIYFLDYPFTENSPEIFTDDVTLDDYPGFTWSPDGKYFAYSTIQDDEKTLWLWDEEINTSIFKYKELVGEFDWGPENQLAFTEFQYPGGALPTNKGSTEIFIWDGEQTTSLSQNPDGEDRYPAWNSDGQLAFLSEWQDGEYDIFIWDGVSKTNGIPDKNSFKNIAPNETFYYSDPVWTNLGTLSFQSGVSSPKIEIHEWDGDITTNISQNPEQHSGGQSWRDDGYWAFVTYFSSEQLIFIKDNHNQTVLSTVGIYKPLWGQSGNLLFCNWERQLQKPDWRALMWNGSEVEEIILDNFIKVSWRNGKNIQCSG